MIKHVPPKFFDFNLRVQQKYKSFIDYKIPLILRKELMVLILLFSEICLDSYRLIYHFIRSEIM